MVYVPKGFTTDPYFNAIGSKAPDFRAWGVVYLKRKERRGLRKRVLYKQYARRKIYKEAGIDHIRMYRELSNNI
jgi:hypothetical protein